MTWVKKSSPAEPCNRVPFCCMWLLICWHLFVLCLCVISPQLAARKTVALQRRAVASSSRLPQGYWWRGGGGGKACRFVCLSLAPPLEFSLVSYLKVFALRQMTHYWLVLYFHRQLQDTYGLKMLKNSKYLYHCKPVTKTASVINPN